jgi:outer membrane lipoprotein carrier protein
VTCLKQTLNLHQQKRVPHVSLLRHGLLLIWLVLSTFPSHAQSIPTAAKMAATVDHFYDSLHALRAQFTEIYTGPGLNRSEGGTLLLAKPGLMRWDYANPAGKVFLVDGKDAYFYSPGAGDAQRMPVKKLDDLRSPLRFLLGKTRLAKELDGLTLAQVNGLYRLQGIPHFAASHDGSSQVTSLALDVNAEGEIQRISSSQLDGTTITFVLTGPVLDPKLAADTFKFVAPAGVKVVEGLQAQ